MSYAATEWMNLSEQEMKRVELTAMLDRIKELKQAPELSVHAPVDTESRRSGVPSSAHRRRDS